jgi:hypothetical protein
MGKEGWAACGKGCGIENQVRDFFWQRPVGRFLTRWFSGVKAMSSNQLCN